MCFWDDGSVVKICNTDLCTENNKHTDLHEKPSKLIPRKIHG